MDYPIYKSEKSENLFSKNKEVETNNTNQEFYHSSDNIHKKNTTSTLSGNSTLEVKDKNKFNTQSSKNMNKNLLSETRNKIIEKIKNQYKQKEINYIIKDTITKNDEDLNKQLLINKTLNYQNNKVNINNNTYEGNEKMNSNNKINENINNLTNIIKPINDNIMVTQFNTIFPKEKKDKKILEKLKEITEEKTEKEKNKTIDSIEKNNNNIKENKEIIKEKLIEKTKSLKKKKKYIIPENIKTEKIVPTYKFISSLNELDSLSNEEKIEKLYEINIYLYQELIETRTKNNLLIEELKRKGNENKDDKYKGYLLYENEQLIKKNHENERIIDYLLKKLNMSQLNENKHNIGYYEIRNKINFKKKRLKKKKHFNLSDILEINNIHSNRNDRFINSSNSNINYKIKSSSMTKNILNSDSPIKTSILDLKNNNNIINNKNIVKNIKNYSNVEIGINKKNEFFDYYKIDRIKTCYACLFGINNYSKGYSPIVYSPNYLSN